MNIYSLSYTINSDALLSTMFFMILGVFFASSYTIFIKKFRGEFVLSLIDARAFDKSSAKSLSELGLDNGFLRRISINTKFLFSPDYYVVEVIEDIKSSENSETKEETKVKTLKYYVNEDFIPRLEAKYGNAGITIVQLIITIIAFFAVALILATVVPDFFEMFDAF